MIRRLTLTQKQTLIELLGESREVVELIRTSRTKGLRAACLYYLGLSEKDIVDIKRKPMSDKAIKSRRRRRSP